jgi:hypothetical protein
MGGLVAMLVRMFDPLFRYDVPDRAAMFRSNTSAVGGRSLRDASALPNSVGDLRGMESFYD